jgi:hypothetical protein
MIYNWRWTGNIRRHEISPELFRMDDLGCKGLDYRSLNLFFRISFHSDDGIVDRGRPNTKLKNRII